MCAPDQGPGHTRRTDLAGLSKSPSITLYERGKQKSSPFMIFKKTEMTYQGDVKEVSKEIYLRIIICVKRHALEGGVFGH